MALDKIIIEIIKDNISLFDCYKNVFVFGSVLDSDISSNDLDILLVYEVYESCVTASLKNIRICLERVCHLPVDLTVLSIDEMKETNFLKRIKLYVQVK